MSRCKLCELDATATYEGIELCDYCAATAELGHLRQTGQLRARLSLDLSQFETARGIRLLPVVRYWRWGQATYRQRAWTTIWYVVAVDPETGKEYIGRGAGPGKPLTLREKQLPKRLRQKMGEP
jgi:hypothetical protein